MDKCALVVDEERASCELVREVLRAEGVETVRAADGAQAGRCALAQKFDAVFIGLSSPSAEALELIRTIRSLGFNRMTPIILLSNSPVSGALSEAFIAGATFFIHKPIDRVRLLNLVRATQGAIEHERRRFRRILVRVKVSVQCASALLEGETTDLSLNGALVSATRTFSPGSLVDLKFHLVPGMKPLAGSGLVMRTTADNQMGIQLDRLPAVEAERLQDYLLPLING